MDGAVKDLFSNYQSEERSLVEQLFFTAKHHGTIGTYREQVWQEMFENIIPKKFVIEQSVFILDSNGKISHEVDLAILDVMYTPYIFKKGSLKFIPIEAVAVAIQCKSVSTPSSSKIEEWVTSIKQLKTKQSGIARMATTLVQGKGSETQKATRPILIYCNLKGSEQGTNEKYFDITITASEKEKKLEMRLHEESFKSIHSVYKHLNFSEVGTDDYRINGDDREIEQYRVPGSTLLSLNFILNQALMLLNNPMLFPHIDYVNLFKEKEGNVDGKSDI